MEVDVDGLLPGGRMKISEQSNNVFCLHLISTNYGMVWVILFLVEFGTAVKGDVAQVMRAIYGALKGTW